MLAELAVLIKADIKQFQKNIGTAKSSLNNFGSTATSVGTKLTASLTLPIAGVGITALKTASDFEQLEVRLKTLTGSARAGTKQFQRLQQFSAGTPFQLQDLVQANNTLLGFGMNAEDAFTSLQQLGDVASATGADLQSIAVAFGQSSAEGKLFTRDIRQFINQGVPAVDLLAQSMGVARSEVFTLAEEGKISFQILQDAIAKSTQAGGKFAGATQAQSQTIAGLFSTLKDNVALALGELGNEIAEAFDLKKLVKDITRNIKAVTTVFKALSSDVKKRMLIVAGILGAGGPVLLAIGLLIKGIMAISAPVIALIAVVTGISYVFANAFGKSGSFVGAFKLIFAKMVNFVIDGVLSLLKTMEKIPGVGKAFGNLAEKVSEFKQKLPDTDDFTPFSDGFNEIKRTFNDMLVFLDRAKLQMSDAFKADVDPPDTSDFAQRITNDVIAPIKLAKVEIVALPSLFINSFKNMANAVGFTKKLADQFTSSFGQGMSNVIVQGEKLVDVLKNIGKLLLSSAIQIGIQALLTGGLGGTGFFGDAGGLFGKIFNRQRGGSVLGNTPYMVGEVGPELFVPSSKGTIIPNRDLMGAGATNINLSGEFRVKGTDLVLSLERANQVIGR